MKKTLLSFMLFFFALSALAQSSPQQQYIDKWAPTAVREMYRSGVPASITLAQGFLESRYGLSILAADGNNHFGIKCHKDWTGKRQFHDDDEKGECFRVYDSAEESFRDHSDFLRYRDRYKFLFELETTDYKGWAHGLKKAGYATDPNYAAKLIKYIEDYKLYEYDRMTVSEVEKEALELSSGVAGVKTEAPETSAAKVDRKTGKTAGKAYRKASKAEKRASRKVRAETDEVIPDRIPDSPLSIEEPKKLDKSQLEEFRFSLSREMYSRNGVPYVKSIDGETYSSIALQNGLFLKEILKFNDLKADEALLPGTIVYLQAKKRQSEKGLDKFIVDDDSQTLRDICQRFGVKMSSVCKMNGFDSHYQPGEGDTIVLRGKKRN